MKRDTFLPLLLLTFVLASPSHAELDLDQEVLIIPDTHNEKPYVWNVLRNPKGYELILEYGEGSGPGEIVGSFLIKKREDSEIVDLHLFITDNDLHHYRHLRPARGNDGRYAFGFDAPVEGKYRMEVVFTDRGRWVNLSEDIKVRKARKGARDEILPGDEDYSVKARLIPKRIYTEHAVTILYGISYKGSPLSGLEKIDGFDMQVASWDEDMKEFLYVTSKQNLGGPDVPVSLVFRRTGKHAVFAEFRHKGVTRKVDLTVTVYEEPRHDKYSIGNLPPSW